jgi:hypothetical protein
MKAKLPDGPSVWPAFWLVGNSKTNSHEIDVIEYYGVAPGANRITEHLWTNGVDTLQRTIAANVPNGSLSAHYNSFGVLIAPQESDYYLEGMGSRPEFPINLEIIVSHSVNSQML